MNDTPSVRLTKLAKCAGCGAKVGAGVLQKLLDDLPTRYDPRLIVGFDKSDDASVYKISDELAIVQTVDFFPPVADDPYLFGQIAAANALSDIYAMGGTPVTAQNVLILPDGLPDESVRSILRGGYDKVFEAGATLSGGHSIHGAEPVYGLAVTGFVHPAKIWTNSGARAGDRLILSKPLGMGIYLTARKAGMLEDAAFQEAVDHMTCLNRAARDAAAGYHVHACTDITGFSLMGHAVEMAEGSSVSLHMNADSIPLLRHAQELADMGLNPEGMYRNRTFAQSRINLRNIPLSLSDVLFDPQTSGGLLLAVAPEDAGKALESIQMVQPDARDIGFADDKGEWMVVMT